MNNFYMNNGAVAFQNGGLTEDQVSEINNVNVVEKMGKIFIGGEEKINDLDGNVDDSEECKNPRYVKNLVVTPKPFPESGISTTTDNIKNICSIITAIFKEKVYGFVGVSPEIVQVNNVTKINLSLILEQHDPEETFNGGKYDKVKLTNILTDSNASNPLASAVSSVIQAGKIDKYKLSTQGIKILKPYVKGIKSIVVSEVPDYQKSYIKISGLNIEKCLEVIYGKEDPNLGELDYVVTLTNLNDIRDFSTIGDGNRIIQITRYNKKELQKLVAMTNTGHNSYLKGIETY